ncbi:MAG: hypothetical protein AVDCRST_MAG26-408 [uncultured Chloroflexia bacterium]|uniref:Uncharacterized protein n=1 Tax=uncultured Chloroflexia bacterium TaxID=1672391 RepID=A0A6J4HAQ6_9CHLR|nr:MAG: hypothetical protein AVDCRST_MAG26-408 [uncultured Chloroflexia bacterium]
MKQLEFGVADFPPAWEQVAALYRAVLDLGRPATETLYACLRQYGIEPTVHVAGELFVSNPVLVPGYIVDRMTEDLNRFVDQRRDAVRDAAGLLALVPPEVRAGLTSDEVAAVLWERLQSEPPLASLDAFLVDTGNGLAPSYIEWQTVGTYATMARWALRCAHSAWGPLAAASPVATRGWDMATLDRRLATLYLAGIEDDPRRGVILDYKPLEQKSRREFFAIQELTGGPARGWGILDPREVVYMTLPGSARAQPCYRRDGALVPIHRAYSRLVHSDIVGRLLPDCTLDERSALQRLFGDPNIHWVSHPIHFYYGTKANFVDYHRDSLSPYVPETRLVTDDLLDAFRRAGRDPLTGLVYKPTLGNSGQAVEADPALANVEPGGLLQARIHPVACHPTLFGPRVPEIRLMGIPDAGRLTGAALYNRVMPVDSFKSNASVVAARGEPGTGEGFGFVVW